MVRTFPTQIKLDGGTQPPPTRRELRAGPLTMMLEDGDLRSIRWGDKEIVRRVYVAVRDPNWATVPATHSHQVEDVSADRFSIAFDAEHLDGDIHLVWHGVIRGFPDGTVSYTMRGVARSTFMKNRIGFCVLHPMACAGARCLVEGVDGATREAAFPQEISPHEPFKEFQALRHEVDPGRWVTVRFTGDVFETEDQRNWTDASFKTYSTPLRFPYPVEVAAGTVISQSFTLSVRGDLRAEAQVVERPAPTVSIDPAQTRHLPDVGLGMASHDEPLEGDELARLRALHLSHLRVDLDLGSAFEERLREAARQAEELAIPLEIAVFLSPPEHGNLLRLREMANALHPAVARWLVFHRSEKATSAGWIRLARDVLAGVAPGAAFGGGTNAYFAELNRNRPTGKECDLLCYAINPQVHAFDNASLIETLQAQAATLASARAFCGSTPLVVSPVTLRPRFNPNATGPEPEPKPGTLPPAVDRRQMSLFAAAWTMGSIKYLALGGAAAATYYETTGWRGVMETKTGSPVPQAFRSEPAMLFPLFHVLADIGEFAGGRVVSSTSSDPLQVDSLVLTRGNRTRMLVANTSDQACAACIVGIDAGRVRVRHLDDASFEQATLQGEQYRGATGETVQVETGTLHVPLRPFAVARIEYEVAR